MKFKNYHEPVLKNEALSYLNLKKGDIVFDGTLGGAGHTIEIIKAIAPTGKLIGVDLSSQAISTATTKLKEYLNSVYLINDNFASIKKIVAELNIKRISGLLLDLGLSSFQIDKSKKGFSYIRNEKLDMRFGDVKKMDAYKLVNQYSQSKLREIFYKYGEERWSGRIAKSIERYRKSKKIEYTQELVEIIRKSIPIKYRKQRKGHPAKKIFQAIRVEVNNELGNLKKVLKDGFEILRSGGRIVVISYHSLEDRIVKENFKIFSGKCICPPDLPVCKCGAEKRAEIITKKIVRPSYNEIKRNPRSRSAKLRVLEKI